MCSRSVDVTRRVHIRVRVCIAAVCGSEQGVQGVCIITPEPLTCTRSLPFDFTLTVLCHSYALSPARVSARAVCIPAVSADESGRVHPPHSASRSLCLLSPRVSASLFCQLFSAWLPKSPVTSFAAQVSAELWTNGASGPGRPWPTPARSARPSSPRCQRFENQTSNSESRSTGPQRVCPDRGPARGDTRK